MTLSKSLLPSKPQFPWPTEMGYQHHCGMTENDIHKIFHQILSPLFHFSFSKEEGSPLIWDKNGRIYSVN